MGFTEKRYRLRIQKKVVGYLRQISNTSSFYSPDGFWWSGRKIDYKQVDEWTGLKDKNNRPIHEWDIVYFKIYPEQTKRSKGVILWKKQTQEFGIRALEEEVFIPLEVNGIQMFNPRKIEVFSYLFFNPELREMLGLED